jgi:transposase
VLVFFFDEGRFGLKPCTGKQWLRKGKQSTVTIKPGYKSLYVYSAVCPKTGDQFPFILPSVNTETMNIYLDKFKEKFPNNKIILVLDQAGWHRSKELIIPEGFSLEHLPPYSPELNPVERLWRCIRQNFFRNRCFNTLKEIENTIMTSWHIFTNSFLKQLYAYSYL